MSNRPHYFHRAFFLIDTLFGLIIISAVTVTLLATVRHERTAENKLRDSTSALHLAEHALLNLQHGQPMPAVDGDTRLTIHPAAGGVAPAGYAWAKVDATVHGHHRELIGVVPAEYLSRNLPNFLNSPDPKGGDGLADGAIGGSVPGLPAWGIKKDQPSPVESSAENSK